MLLQQLLRGDATVAIGVDETAQQRLHGRRALRQLAGQPFDGKTARNNSVGGRWAQLNYAQIGAESIQHK